MEKDFTPYEQALALKELGFNRRTLAQYNTRQGNEWILTFDLSGEGQYPNSSSACIAPTFSQAFRWFRDKKYQAEILWRGDFGDFCWKIGRFKYGSHFFSEDGFNTYEEAELECLKKLIEIVKTKEVC